MIAFIVKSTICLSILYGFYHLFLRNTKLFHFNRYYLLCSLLFAVIVPLIVLPLPFNNPLNLQFLFRESSSISFPSESNEMMVDGDHIRFRFLFLITIFVVSSVLFLRFVHNLWKIGRIVRENSKIEYGNSQIVLIDDDSLPYSFFRYIFVNRERFLNGTIENELITHENTHCAQKHSIDVLLVEFLYIFFWFNPFVWLFRKAIQLNHEYLADEKVLSTHEIGCYQNILLKIVFRNHSTYLASNFSYSLTKKRLIMAL